MTTPVPPAAPLAPFAAFADFGKMVPGFDFLQSLAQQAGAAPAAAAAPPMPGFPGMGSNPWAMPTLNVQDLERRIQELKTVQFWLDQNAIALRATIQAMEVQKMTLAALGSMNVGFGEMVNAFQPKPAAPAKSASKSGGKAKPAAKVFAGLEIPPKRQALTVPESDVPAAVNPALVDPMQWWGALAQQFQVIAADAVKNTPQPLQQPQPPEPPQPQPTAPAASAPSTPPDAAAGPASLPT